MDNRLAAISAITDPNLSQATPRRGASNTGASGKQAVAIAPDAADLRLVIEEGGGSYVYKTIDRRTGEVVAQFPREEILRMREEASYEAGAVINASA